MSEIDPVAKTFSTHSIMDVAVDLPVHSRLGGMLSYEGNVEPGTLVRVPLGKKNVAGIVWDTALKNKNQEDASFELKATAEIFTELKPLSEHWRALVKFTSRYYQRSLGEVALQALPPDLRKLTYLQLQRKLARLSNKIEKEETQRGKTCVTTHAQKNLPELTSEQAAVLSRIDEALSTLGALKQESSSQNVPAAFLLQGATGSGKTEVYMRATQTALQQNPQAQILVLVPEINLTPQLEERYRLRFPDISIVTMHSGMTSVQRLQSWLLAHMGKARVILGTRMAVFASLPTLKMIIIDEEHDPSYKQYEGARWSARDLAVWRGRQEQVPVVLGSATPSLESYLHACRGTYALLNMPSRIGGGDMPLVRMVDMQHMPRNTMLAPALVDAIQERINRKEQSLILLNRRGYAPVLYCPSCGWKSQCPHCSAFRVFHRADRSLRCHHCSLAHPVPKVCPDCGDPDLQPIGKGTERLEELLQEMFIRPDGEKVTVMRIDADSTRLAGSLNRQLQQVHEGDIDILVGTQMIAKGHDFRKVTLVAAVNPDAALFSSDFRSGERLFSLLLQAAGRAGREETLSETSEFWVQTWQPTHPLYQALKTYDFSTFAASTLSDRESAAMPPYSYLCLIRAEGRTQDSVQNFLKATYDLGQEMMARLKVQDKMLLYPPIPAAMQRVAGMERGQMLAESTSRQALQLFLAHWQAEIHALQARGIVRWAIDVDPQSV